MSHNTTSHNTTSHNTTSHNLETLEEQNRKLIAVLNEARRRLADAEIQMQQILLDPIFFTNTPMEVWTSMERTDNSLAATLAQLSRALNDCVESDNGQPRAPTALEGQFLAYINHYVQQHHKAPSQAELQKYFGKTQTEVSLLLKQLEQAGFIRRNRKKPRSMRVVAAADLIPELQQPEEEPLMNADGAADADGAG